VVWFNSSLWPYEIVARELRGRIAIAVQRRNAMTMIDLMLFDSMHFILFYLAYYICLASRLYAVIPVGYQMLVTHKVFL